MFVFGLLFGPAVGIGLAHILSRSTKLSAVATYLVYAVAALILLLVPVLPWPLRLGLAGGFLLGLLLDATPAAAPARDAAEPQP